MKKKLNKNQWKNFNKLLIIFAIFFGFIITTEYVSATNNWVDNPNSCPASDVTNFPGQSCPGSDKICGDDGGNAQCYDMSSMSAPGSDSSASNTQYGGLTSGGFVVDCYATPIDAGQPYCDNNGGFWCNRDPQCVGWHRDTICKANTFAYQASSYECSNTCQSGYNDCDADGNNCEIHDSASCGISSQGAYLGCSGANGNCTCRYDAGSGTGTNGSASNYFDCDSSTATVGDGCESQYHGTASCGGHAWITGCSAGSATCSCQSGNIDFDDNDGDADINTGASGNGCEIVTGEACTMNVGGVSGTCAGNNSANTGTADSDGDPCNCIGDKSYFETGTLSSYSTSDPLLWGQQFGGGDLIHFGNASSSDIFMINNDGAVQMAQISAPTTTTDRLYNVGGNLYWDGTIVGTASSGGEVLEYIYRPYDASPSGRVYNDFATLYSAFSSVDGNRKIIFDATGDTTPGSETMNMSAGTYDFKDTELAIIPGTSEITVNFADGTTFTNFPIQITGIILSCNNTSAPVYSHSSAGIFVVSLKTAALRNYGSQSIITVNNAGSVLNVQMDGWSTIQRNSYEVFDIQSTYNNNSAKIVMHDNSRIISNSIRGASGQTVSVEVNTTSATIETTQTNLPVALNMIWNTDASLQFYDNTTSGLTADNVQSAIDELSGSGSSSGSILDGDSDTSIQTDEGGLDDDTIRFDLGGGTPIGNALMLNQSNGFVWNINNDDLDFVIHGNHNNNLLFLDASANNISFGGPILYSPSTDQSIVAATGINPLMSYMRVQGSGGSVTVTATPNISDGSDGQMCILQGVSDANLVTLQDSGNLTGSGLELSGGVDFTLGQGDILNLIYDQGDDAWYEVSRSDN